MTGGCDAHGVQDCEDCFELFAGVTRGVFGTWDAPITDDLPMIETPVGHRCMWCRERVEEGDNGRVYEGLIEHRECSFRNVMGGIGHHVNHTRFCHGELGPDAGLDRRTSSLLTWGFYVDGEDVTEEQLDVMRQAMT